jgi:uncharacterized membrane protein YfbV (UPF0208 family)
MSVAAQYTCWRLAFARQLAKACATNKLQLQVAGQLMMGSAAETVATAAAALGGTEAVASPMLRG